MTDISSSDFGNFTKTTSQILNDQSAEMIAQNQNQKKKEQVQKTEQRVIASDTKNKENLFEKQSSKLDFNELLIEKNNKPEILQNTGKFYKQKIESQKTTELQLGLDKVKDPNELAFKQEALDKDLGLDPNPDLYKFSPKAIAKEAQKEKEKGNTFEPVEQEVKESLVPSKTQNQENLEIKAKENEKNAKVIEDKEKEAKEEGDLKAAEVIKELNKVDFDERNAKDKESPTEKSLREENLQAFAKRPALTETLLNLTDERLDRLNEREEQFERLKKVIRDLEDSGGSEELVETKSGKEAKLVKDNKETSAFNPDNNKERNNQTLVSQNQDSQFDVTEGKNKDTLSNSFSKQVDPTKQFDKGTDLQQVASDVSKKQDDAVDEAVKVAKEREKLTEVLSTKDEIIKETDINSQEEVGKVLERSTSAFSTPTPDEVVEKRRFVDYKRDELEVREVVQARKDFTNEQKSLTVKDKEIYPTELSAYAQIEAIDKKEEVSSKERPLIDAQSNKREFNELLEKKQAEKNFIEKRFFLSGENNTFDKYI